MRFRSGTAVQHFVSCTRFCIFCFTTLAVQLQCHAPSHASENMNVRGRRRVENVSSDLGKQPRLARSRSEQHRLQVSAVAGLETVVASS